MLLPMTIRLRDIDSESLGAIFMVGMLSDHGTLLEGGMVSCVRRGGGGSPAPEDHMPVDGGRGRDVVSVAISSRRVEVAVTIVVAVTVTVTGERPGEGFLHAGGHPSRSSTLREGGNTEG